MPLLRHWLVWGKNISTNGKEIPLKCFQPKHDELFWVGFFYSQKIWVHERSTTFGQKDSQLAVRALYKSSWMRLLQSPWEFPQVTQKKQICFACCEASSRLHQQQMNRQFQQKLLLIQLQSREEPRWLHRSRLGFKQTKYEKQPALYENFTSVRFTIHHPKKVTKAELLLGGHPI